MPAIVAGFCIISIMSLSVGIVGLPNAGKSTLFNALLSRKQAPVGAHPFTTVKPNTGVVKVADTRLEKLSKLVKPAKTTSTTVKFIDIAGLVKGAHQGEGLGNEFLAQIRGVDVICHVVREFQSSQVSHVMGSIDPLRDREVVQTELKLKDLETLERASKAKKSSIDLKNAAKKIVEAINKEKSISTTELTKSEEAAIKHLQLLSAKPFFFVLNVAEEDLEELKGEVKKLSQKLENSVVICAKLEEEFTDLAESERGAYRREMGLRGSGLDRVINRAYQMLELITFYTVKGAAGKKGEVRAWAVSRGTNALEAAERVHTDFAKGFILAEVIGIEKLLTFESFIKAREAGKVKQEGRDYKVKDGDVVEFKVRL